MDRLSIGYDTDFIPEIGRQHELAVCIFVCLPRR